jgi:hypothetical protein
MYHLSSANTQLRDRSIWVLRGVIQLGVTVKCWGLVLMLKRFVWYMEPLPLMIRKSPCSPIHASNYDRAGILYRCAGKRYRINARHGGIISLYSYAHFFSFIYIKCTRGTLADNCNIFCNFETFTMKQIRNSNLRYIVKISYSLFCLELKIST